MTTGLLPAIARGARFVLHRQGFESRTTATTAGAIHAYDARGAGDLPTIVVLHGLGSSALNFRSVLTRVRRHTRRVVAPDLLGHGFSDTPGGRLSPEGMFAALRETLDALVGEPFVLVGSSLGGALALRYALEQPRRLRGLALVSPAGARMTAAEWSALLQSFKIESPAGARALLGRLYHRPPWYLPALAPGFADLMRRPAIRDLVDAATLDDLPSPESLSALAMPILLLWGQSERLLPRSSLGYFRRHLPSHAVIEEPVGFGHCPHLDAPAQLAHRLVEFARAAALAGGGTEGALAGRPEGPAPDGVVLS